MSTALFVSQIAYSMEGTHDSGRDTSSVVSVIISIFFASDWKTAISWLGIFLVSAIIARKKPRSFYFSHYDGSYMRALPGDTRSTRFTHG